ncbi:SDR family oxidoreductase [Alienimonas chondri]|uniref:Quinone oxidoreductase 2 n=1 Tax=Alienimonas chondri TaxID=2681879 RepID=A0ABX1V812_9PLAN|nr:SDR family oxidoreductase [Alienimonas chondri]NNJ24312.1 Quinone oxidoreductase 2 [Alienimonas chondri]
MTVFVTGATGALGGKIVDRLAGGDATVIAGARNPDRANALREKVAEVRRCDYDDPASMRTAFEGVDVLMLIPSLAAVEPRIRQHADTLTAAKEAGVSRVAFASFMAAEPDSRFHVAPFLLYAESKLRLSGLDWTIARDGMYLDPVADWIPDLIRVGKLPYPVRHGRVSYIGRDDLARAFAALCTGDGHSERLYKLTGPRAVSMQELAAAVSRHTGEEITYERVSEERFIEICKAGEEPEELINVLLSMYRAVEHGEFEEATDHVKQLTGEPAASLEEFFAGSGG